nr:pantoate--beta-alanine ligase [Saprospiraceae bacterium]
LHPGHISLIEASNQKADITVCSIFVNPTQFDESRDLSKYPRTVEADTALLVANGCDVVYLPSVADIYPNGMELETPYEIGRLEHIIEGASRPGHYQGVAQVVHRLLSIVAPDWLFLGQKDYQQVMVLSEVVRRLDLSTEIEMCPIKREPDGLAMSSRNVRLQPEERIAATELSKTLFKVKDYHAEHELSQLKLWATMNLNLHPLIEVDYLKFCNAQNLEEIQAWEEADSVVLLGAIRIGEIRLIDNLIIF